MAYMLTQSTIRLAMDLICCEIREWRNTLVGCYLAYTGYIYHLGRLFKLAEESGWKLPKGKLFVHVNGHLDALRAIKRLSFTSEYHLELLPDA